MSNGRSDDNNRRSGFESDDNSDDNGLYYYVYGSDDDHEDNGNHPGHDDDHESNGNHYGWGDGHEGNGNHYGRGDDHEGNGNHYGWGDDHEVKIDFDSGIVAVDSVYSIGSNIDVQSGTYTEDGYTLTWSQLDIHYDFESVLDDAPFFDNANADDDHANDHSDNVFGVNYLGDNTYDGYEYATGTLTKDDGSSFSLEGLDVANTGNSTNPDEFNLAQIQTDVYNPGVLDEFKYAYSYDLETWEYAYETYDYATDTWAVVSSGSGDLEDAIDTGFFDDISALIIYTYGDMTMDNIELEGIA